MTTLNLTETTKSELPKSGTRCTDVLSDTLQGYAGIHQAEFDLQNGHLNLTYDPDILNNEHALSLVRKASRQAYGRVLHCASKGETTCGACAVHMGKELFDHYQQLSKVQSGAQTRYQNGRMQIQITAQGSESVELSQAEAFPVSQQAEKPRPRGMPREHLEIILTAANAVTTLIAYLGQSFGLLSPATAAVLYALAYFSGGYYGLLDGIAVLRERRLDVNLLMILAALGAAIIGQPAEGAALLFLFSLSNTLQTYAMGRSRKAIEKLLDLRPAVATVRRGSRLVSLPIEKLVLGDIVVVRPGERLPIDGEVVDGSSAVDQSTITGESVPVEKEAGDSVFAGTVNGNGALEIRVTQLAKDTTLAKIVQMVEEAQANKAKTQRMLDDFEQYYAIFVLAGAVLLAAIPYWLMGQAFYPTFYRAMTWLVVASPCALVISTLASILSAIANGARRGVLFKGGVHLEQTANLKVVAFDKTGTLTTGTPALNQLILLNGIPKMNSCAWRQQQNPVPSIRSPRPLSQLLKRKGSTYRWPPIFRPSQARE